MGAEAKTTGVIDGRKYAGTLLLESDYLLFRSPPDFRWKLALSEARELVVRDGHLVVNGNARFALGDAVAAKWIDKIRNPKSLIDKLGVKPEHRVGLAGPVPEDFGATLAGRLNSPATSRLKQNLDVVFVFLETPADLGRIQKARDAIAADGMIWLVYPKGGKTIKEPQVREATFALGLVDVKVAGFSATLTAVKVVIPVTERKSNVR